MSDRHPLYFRLNNVPAAGRCQRASPGALSAGPPTSPAGAGVAAKPMPFFAAEPCLASALQKPTHCWGSLYWHLSDAASMHWLAGALPGPSPPTNTVPGKRTTRASPMSSSSTPSRKKSEGRVSTCDTAHGPVGFWWELAVQTTLDGKVISAWFSYQSFRRSLYFRRG